MNRLFESAGLSAQAFLRDYWQQRPLLLRQAFPGFVPALDANDIAGLACDELAESRLVSGSDARGEWNLRYGPFGASDLEHLPTRDWTLLVQDVEKHYPPLQEWLTAFDFLPRWRIDDLMVSVAAPGGSVGPHVDQYDVFLVQVAGRRRWQIAEAFDPTPRADVELDMLQAFEPEQEWTLEAGDMLYLPPGVAHHGVAEAVDGDAGSLCMTWSVGMRAPSAADLLQAFGEWLAAGADEGGRYVDRGIEAAIDPGLVDATAVQGFEALLRAPGSDPSRFRAFLGSFLSAYRLAHEPAPPERTVGAPGLLRALQAGARLRPHPWTRLLWLEDGAVQGDGALLFAAGSMYPCSRETAAAACNPTGLDAAQIGRLEGAAALLAELVTRGHLLLETV